MSDESVEDGEKKDSGMNASGAGLGLMIGVLGTWIIFDSLALGLLVGMAGMIIGGSTGKGSKAGSGGAAQD